MRAEVIADVPDRIDQQRTALHEEREKLRWEKWFLSTLEVTRIVDRLAAISDRLKAIDLDLLDVGEETRNRDEVRAKLKGRR
jgi:hypothetical protein